MKTRLFFNQQYNNLQFEFKSYVPTKNATLEVPDYVHNAMDSENKCIKCL